MRFTKRIIDKRNSIAHDGEFATADEATLALECADVLRQTVVSAVAKNLGFKLDEYKCWNVAHLGYDDFDPDTPFT